MFNRSVYNLTQVTGFYSPYGRINHFKLNTKLEDKLSTVRVANIMTQSFVMCAAKHFIKAIGNQNNIVNSINNS